MKHVHNLLPLYWRALLLSTRFFFFRWHRMCWSPCFSRPSGACVLWSRSNATTTTTNTTSSSTNTNSQSIYLKLANANVCAHTQSVRMEYGLHTSNWFVWMSVCVRVRVLVRKSAEKLSPFKLYRGIFGKSEAAYRKLCQLVMCWMCPLLRNLVLVVIRRWIVYRLYTVSRANATFNGMIVYTRFKPNGRIILSLWIRHKLIACFDENSVSIEFNIFNPILPH